jgi:myo-inositol-1(or 4)-monophosphatase
VPSTRADDLRRVEHALETACAVIAGVVGPSLTVDRKAGGDPVTDADRAVDVALRSCLPTGDDAWLSEESADDPIRLGARRVWIVDPLDGTREFVIGLPEWCISIALIEDGRAVVGGICNPATRETILGAEGLGVTLNGAPVRPRQTVDLAEAEVLASRSEFDRGEWREFCARPLRVRPCGSVAYKLGLVAAGLTDATWTLTPKHEWDIAAGVALVRAAGAAAWVPSGEPLTFNQPKPWVPGLVAVAPGLANPVRTLLDAR